MTKKAQQCQRKSAHPFPIPIPVPPPPGPNRAVRAPPPGSISAPHRPAALRTPSPSHGDTNNATATDPGTRGTRSTPGTGGRTAPGAQPQLPAHRSILPGTATATSTGTERRLGELAAARRRLVAAEGRRKAAAELEGRVLQVHCALRHAELRLAARAETLGRLGAGVAQAQLALAAQGQRLQKGLRRRSRLRSAPLLAAARALRSCVPWAAPRSRRSAACRLPAAPRSPA
ncbi:LOW QUALITY PROTEIN: TMF-regulated nuclear protein 1 [Anas platyrhynchos]|uniref:LOW QUALITY PROTEIN: TMF-regulated nuclear protein 1 n=1 Tax=Anas platyrhynchos TaxID=8839 RepID=UPI003AF2944F